MIEQICSNYIDGKILMVRPYGDGHINDTYLVETEKERYILQRVQKNMDISKLEYNYNLYSKVFDECGWLYPGWIRIKYDCNYLSPEKTNEKQTEFFCTDETGDNWRMYPFIKGEEMTCPLTEENLYKLGQGLAEMHMIFRKIKEKPRAVYPKLHDLKGYYEEYQKLLFTGDLSEEYRNPLVEKQFETEAADFIDLSFDDMSIVHGDAKLANVIFWEGRVVGFLDFDTIMWGASAEDIADCIRSSCVTNDGKLDIVSADSLIRGYASVSGNSVNELKDKIRNAFNKICFELALRYYKDAISDGTTFKDKYPGYRLGRAKKLLQLSWE
jgi:Putative homoserine kinase type II (protein kinase fold)